PRSTSVPPSPPRPPPPSSTLFPYTTLFRSAMFSRTLGGVTTNPPPVVLEGRLPLPGKFPGWPGPEGVLAGLSPPNFSSIFLSMRSEEHTSELQSRENLVCRLLLEKKNSVVG